ncbi:MAG: hypothetical protein ABSF43_02440 [Rectinemataceae bacterium]|jgi:Kef-type K+ transport system membrane component KefB
MQHAIALVIAVAAVIVIFLAARAAGKNWRPSSLRSSRKPAATAGAEGELVAVIAAAVAAASGMAADSFKVVGVEPSPSKIAPSSIDRSSMASGFNTPPWGHVDRFARREGL